MSDPLHRAVRIWLLKPQVANRRLFGSKLVSGDVDAVCNSDSEGVLTRRLLPRSPQLSAALETVSWCPSSSLWRFHVRCLSHGHTVEYEVSAGADNDDPVLVRVLHCRLSRPDADWFFSETFLSDELSDRLGHWFSQNCTSPVEAPMRLVDVEAYLSVHRRLKAAHSRRLIETWPERTNAEKFVHEDVAIAAYLLTLWAEETGPVRFADLGCGNGLLVYLLAAEGVQGVGLDVRRRRIWDIFPASVIAGRLREVSLDPSQPDAVAQHLPEGTNWLLGNHSDELTPWLPVMAGRLPACNFFVLPCCPYDLFGKFDQPATNGSRYGAYLEFVGRLANRCGFRRVEQDAMRIPSTRRRCWVGWAPAGDAATVASVVEAGRGACSGGFAPRENREPVRNCTQLAPGVRERVCETVFAELLRRGNEGAGWNEGGQMTLGEVCAVVSSDDLAALKAQHGGLQTLLRNHHQAFQVDKGAVRIRQHLRLTVEAAAASGRLKTSACWMQKNHPDGCVRAASDCPFRHAEDESQDVKACVVSQDVDACTVSQDVDDEPRRKSSRLERVE